MFSSIEFFTMFDMDVNVGRTDQLFRVGGGMAMGLLSINALLDSCVPEIYSPIFGAFALVFLLTGATRKCPFNTMLDRDSLEEE